MGCDIHVSYIKEPDSTFFEMLGRQNYAIDNGQVVPDDVQEYFMHDDLCTEGIKVTIPTKHHYTDDYFAVKFNVADIPDEAVTIIVEYG